MTLVLNETGGFSGAVGVFRETAEAPQSLVEGKGAETENNKQDASDKAGENMSLCPWCKKILNGENNQWEPAESHMENHKGDVEFSHCMCQLCAKRLGLFDPETISQDDDMLI